MKIRNKAIGILAFCWFLLIAMVYTVSYLVLEKQFEKIEVQHAQQNIERIHEAIAQDLNDLQEANLDLAYSEKTYDYMENPNPNYIKNFVSSMLLSNGKINDLLLIKNISDRQSTGINVKQSADGVNFKDSKTKNNIQKNIAGNIEYNNQVAYSTSYDTKRHKMKPINNNAKTLWVDTLNKLPKGKNQGIILTDKGISLFTANDIIDGKADSKSVGKLIAISNMGRKYFADLAKNTRFDLSVDFVASMENGKNTLLNKIDKANGKYAYLVGSTMHIDTFVYDITGEPVAVVSTKYEADLIAQGVKIIQFYLMILFIAGILVTVVIWWMLKILILNRLERLSSDVKRIGETRDFSIRASVLGRDEMTQTAEHINKMLSMLEISYGELGKRFEKTSEELETQSVQLENISKEREEVVGKLEKQEQQIKYFMTHDQQTLLPNRFLLNEILDETMDLAKDRGTQYVFCVIEIMNIKKIRENLDLHEIEPFWKEWGEHFTQAVGGHDLFAKLSHDEFAACMPYVGDPQVVVEGFMNMLAKPFYLNKKKFVVECNFGVSLYPELTSEPQELISQAKMALRQVKLNPKENLKYYDHASDTTIELKKQLETELQYAIERNEFKVVYQPKINIQTGTIVGAEALIRWNHPEHGFISPDVFIPIAEDTGLIDHIEHWVFVTACTQAKAWQVAGLAPIKLSVNLSSTQFQTPDIVSKIKLMLEESGLMANFLEIELTERMVVEDINITAQKMTELSALGIHISIDDFGVGYSSMSYLTQLPVNTIKIDKSFVDDLPGSMHAGAIVEALVSLAHNIHMDVVAEGVETPEQCQYLQNVKCDIVQGYLMARPLDVDDMAKALKRNDWGDQF